MNPFMKFSQLLGLAPNPAVAAPNFRITVEPSERNGLRSRSQVMADKPETVRRARIGAQIGTLDTQDVARLNVALALVMGLAD